MIGPWIAETQAKKVTAQAEVRTATGRRSMSRDEIEAVVAAFGDLARVVQGADPADKAEIYAMLRLTLTYEPEEREVKAIIKPGLDMRKGFVFEGDLNPETGEISPVRGNHAIKVTRTGRKCPDIPRSVRYLVRCLACARLRAGAGYLSHMGSAATVAFAGRRAFLGVRQLGCVLPDPGYLP